MEGRRRVAGGAHARTGGSGREWFCVRFAHVSRRARACGAFVKLCFTSTFVQFSGHDGTWVDTDEDAQVRRHSPRGDSVDT